MHGQTHNLRRIATGIVLATTAAALLVPASLASSNPRNYGPPDPWMLPYLNSNPGALSTGFLTDTTDSARVARTHPARALSGSQPQSGIAPGALHAGFLTDTTDSARVVRIGKLRRLASA
jgi:hypothetical protein